MESVENVATPDTAATVVVPDSLPPLGFVPIATVTLPVKWVAVFPCASCAVTWTAGVIAVPATTFVGCTVKIRRVAASGWVGPSPPQPMIPAASVGSVRRARWRRMALTGSSL